MEQEKKKNSFKELKIFLLKLFEILKNILSSN